jgi:hypothetical protein
LRREGHSGFLGVQEGQRGIGAIAQLFDAHELIFRAGCTDQFVELGWNSSTITVPSVLDQEHHHKGDDVVPVLITSKRCSEATA